MARQASAYVEAHPIAEIIAKRHKLQEKFSPHLFIELINDIADQLNGMSHTVFDDDAVTSITFENLGLAAQMLQDAIYLAALCPTEPAEYSEKN